MTEDLERAIDRVSYLIEAEEDRKITFLTGAGISIPNMPSTAEFVEIFLGELGKSSNSIRQSILSMDEGESYRHVASELKQRRGERGLAAAVRKGVLSALSSELINSASDTDKITYKDWNLPPSQKLFGELISGVPRQQLSAIFTTNFDPLTEASLEAQGVERVTLSTIATDTIDLDAVIGHLPVVHLHGFWEKSATLSTALHLNAERSGVERMINRVLQKSVLIVIGYAGWNDSFMRALSRTVEAGNMANLDAEVLWLSYSPESKLKSNSLVYNLRDKPGVNFYYGVDASKFLKGVISRISELKRDSHSSFVGWEVPPEIPSSPQRSASRAYFMGAHPSWSIAHSMPELSNTVSLKKWVRNLVQISTDNLLIVSAPAGEGKSTAMMQSAISVRSEHSDVNVQFRMPGAQAISPEWILYLRKEFPLSVIFVDEADLVVEEIDQALRDSADAVGGAIIWVLAMHSSYSRSSYVTRLTGHISHRVLDFERIDRADALTLAEKWVSSSILPLGLESSSADEMADRMIPKDGMHPNGESLFGAVLGLWKGDSLTDRVFELMNRLSKLHVSGVNFKYLFSAVAVTQFAWSGDSQRVGLNVAVFAKLAKTDNRDVMGLVINPLGREVGISRVGDNLLVRHPSIAEAVMDILERGGEMSDLAYDIGRQGAKIRYSPNYSEEESKTAYRLTRKLVGESAVRAGMGAIDGAIEYLEPRVTMMATFRSNNDLERANDYALGLEKSLSRYQDSRLTSRGFYVEWSVIEAALGHLDLAIKHALYALSDNVEGPLQSRHLSYALNSLRSHARKLEVTGRSGARELSLAVEQISGLPSVQSSVRQKSDQRSSSAKVAFEAFRIASCSFVDPDDLPLIQFARRISVD